MNIKTYTARTMAEALQQVQSQLGADAVILHTRTYKTGGILGIGAKNVVEVTAAPGQDVGRRRRQDAERNRRRAIEAAREGESGAPRKARPAAAASPNPQELAGDLIRRTYAAARAEMSQQQDQPATPRPVAQAAAQPAKPQAAVTIAPPAPNLDTSRLTEEMKAVKRMVNQIMQQQRGQATATGPAVHENLADYYTRLIEQEVARELADEIVSEVNAGLGAQAADDSDACRKAVCESISRQMPVVGSTDVPSRGPDGRPRTIALIGPTGVGKTTTIAKLAATFKLKHNKNVGLITLDTYRIAAVDQLKTYAEIIGVPLHVVINGQELKRAMTLLAGCDVILIDTAGRSQRDNKRLEELAKFMQIADPHETHLVLSSTCTQRVLLETVERFSQIPTDRIIFTKLDEAVTFGTMLNVVKAVNKRLSYVTTGQEVPHHIEPGEPDRLASLVIGEAGEFGGDGQAG